MGLKPLRRLWIVKTGFWVVPIHTLFKTQLTHSP
ncbi:hypothetical protein SAMN04489743_0293 [Pseudarthrobacter equi]|uniref:Uncharacterized protein n=1 Tax=Pseudarthrobacter equi TaxID=728066 RepID=A0A1H1T3N7_9MICC|nr:hypothetical protein SAMN04489743_0293 [Pseudarthrobacter equi]